MSQTRDMGHPFCVLFLLVLTAGAAGQTSTQPSGASHPANPQQLGGQARTNSSGVAAPSGSPGGFVVVLDAAHGGVDTGARIGNGDGDGKGDGKKEQLLEKDVVLALVVRLRSMLNARGIQVVTTREADANPSALNRAEIANHVMAAACISLHATATGSGVHLFTSSLNAAPSGAASMTRFLPWATAQSAYVAQSLRLSSEVNSAMAHAEVPVSLGRTSLQPLDSFACPAAAVEISPLGATQIGGKPMDLTNPDYQSRVVSALAAAIQQWREDWKKP